MAEELDNQQVIQLTSAKRDCNVAGVNALGGAAGSQPIGNVEGESLFVSAQGPYGRDVPKTLQGDYSTLKVMD